MNEFIAQFLVECRELIEQATADLLALEETPEETARLDSAFRAFHTLKGAAGIVDFHAMGRALHAAEGALASVRAGSQPVSADLVSNALTCLDQVLQWLDVMEATEEPPPGADQAADALIARFDMAVASSPTVAPAPGEAPSGAWIDRLLANGRSGASLALRYTPDRDCFFRGEDPLALVGRLPGLVALRLEPAEPWPSLDALHPYACNLVISALAVATAGDAAAHFRAVTDQVTIQPLAAATGGEPGLADPARAIVLEQVRLLDHSDEETFAGRLGSAGRVVANVLRHVGRGAEVPGLESALAASRASADPSALLAALDRILSEQALADPAEPVPRGHDVAARALRVDVERIDRIVSLAGELTVVKNAVGHAARLAEAGENPAAVAAALKEQHLLLERLVADLQQSVLAIRVLPLRHVFQRFPRLVREIAASLGKPARLLTEGDATDADKAIVENLFEPLLHVVRNSLDHGIEPPERRRAAGKPATATIRLQAARVGEHVVVEVSDDGGGVDLARVGEIAVERGLVSPESLAAMSEAEITDLIFAPGFSTAAAVTGLSGRGVGMDAVRKAVERMGGRVTVASVAGEGTTVRLTLPFTVMMTRVMTVEAGGQAFGVPFEAVVETVRIPRERIAAVGAGEAFVLRDRTIPLIRLARALDLPDGDIGGDASVVVASVRGRLGGLEVDRFGDRLDIMLKPMEGLLAGTPGVAGTTLLGDGRVLIVLDVWELLQ